MAFIRKIKKKSGTYLAEVESYRQDGKVKQRVLRYIGKVEDDVAEQKVAINGVGIKQVKQYLDYNIIHQVSEKLRIPEILGEDLKPILILVYNQLIEKKSLYQLPQYIEETSLKSILGIDKLIDKHLYTALDKLELLDFSELENIILTELKKLSKQGEEDVLVLDVTDTYFNGKEADWKSRKGKDGKRAKLIQIALAVTKESGFPILHKCYEGNINNVKIFEDLLESIRIKDYSLIVLDRGLNSAAVLKDLEQLSQPVITGLKQTTSIRKNYLSKIRREIIFQPRYKISLTKVEVFYKTFNYKKGTLIAIYNPQQETMRRMKAMENEEKYDKDKAKYMGYSLIYHTTKMSANEVVKLYFEKDIVEKAYRNLKSIIQLNPIRKHRLNRILAHVKICYLAYAILIYIDKKVKPLGISGVSALQHIRGVYKVQLFAEKEKIEWSKIVTLKNSQAEIVKILGCSV